MEPSNHNELLRWCSAGAISRGPTRAKPTSSVAQDGTFQVRQRNGRSHDRARPVVNAAVGDRAPTGSRPMRSKFRVAGDTISYVITAPWCNRDRRAP